MIECVDRDQNEGRKINKVIVDGDDPRCLTELMVCGVMRISVKFCSCFVAMRCTYSHWFSIDVCRARLCAPSAMMRSMGAKMNDVSVKLKLVKNERTQAYLNKKNTRKNILIRLYCVVRLCNEPASAFWIDYLVLPITLSYLLPNDLLITYT